MVIYQKTGSNFVINKQNCGGVFIRFEGVSDPLIIEPEKCQTVANVIYPNELLKLCKDLSRHIEKDGSMIQGFVTKDLLLKIKKISENK